MDTSCEIYNSSLEATELWTPGSEVREYSHEQWLTRLACTLIKSGFVKDEVLIVLSPICDVKVIWLACSLLGVWSDSYNFEWAPLRRHLVWFSHGAKLPVARENAIKTK